MRLGLLLFLALAWQTTPTIAAPCKTQGDANAKELSFDIKSEETLRGLRFAFRFGLLPPEFPAKDVAEITAPCSRGPIPLKTGALELFGEDEDSPPRWAKAASPESPIIYVSVMPRPAAAAKWADNQTAASGESVQFNEDDMMFVVALTGPSPSDNRLVFHFFDRVPDDERLKSLIAKIAAREARWQVGFDVKTKGVTPNTQ